MKNKEGYSIIEGMIRQSCDLPIEPPQNEITWASSDKVNKYKKEITEILDALEDIEEGWKGSLLTDESSFGDYDMTKEELALLSFKLQEDIKNTDLIVDIAEKMNKFYESNS
jgi:hypothetical protein